MPKYNKIRRSRIEKARKMMVALRVSRVNKPLLPPPPPSPPSPPREPTEEELAQVTVEDCICQECINLLLIEIRNRNEGNIGNRQLGHQSVCVCCGISLLRQTGRRSHPLLDGHPERDNIATTIEPRQMELEKEKQELKRKLHLDTVDIVGSLESRALRVRPVKRLKSDEEPYSNDGSEQDKNCKLPKHLRGKCEDSVATPVNGEVDVLHQTGDKENAQSQGAAGIPCEKKTGRPRKPAQVGPNGSAAKKKRRPPKSSSTKNKRAPQVLIPKEKIFQMSKPNQACRIIARVYHYLEREYEFIKANTDKSCDLSLLANILKRTSDATGFPVPMVKTILEAEEIRKQKLREAAELQHKAEQREERRLQREFEKESSVKRKKNKNIKKTSNGEVTKVTSETASDMSTCINSDTLVTSGNVSNEGNSEMAAVVESDPLADTVKAEVLDEEYGDRPVNGIQQSSKPDMAITITAPAARSHPPANNPASQLTENECEEPEVYAPPVTDPQELERIEAQSAAGILQALLTRDQDPLC